MRTRTVPEGLKTTVTYLGSYSDKNIARKCAERKRELIYKVFCGQTAKTANNTLRIKKVSEEK